MRHPPRDRRRGHHSRCHRPPDLEIEPGQGRVIAGIVFACIGTAFLLESLGAWRVDLVYMWPISLIAIGVSFLLGRAKRQRIEEDRSAKLAVAEERVRIARELHDIVAHGVSLMTIQIAAARRVASTQPEAAASALGAAEDAGRQALAELRSLLGVLRSADASLGEVRFDSAAYTPTDGVPTADAGDLSSAAPTTPLPRLADVPDLIEGLRAAGLGVVYDEDGPRPPLSPAIELAVYRVVQESLTNVVRHAPGARVRVRLTYRSDGIDVLVEDDGAGLPVPATMAAAVAAGTTAGHGLVGMRERIAATGGWLEAGPPDVGPGWRVIAYIPLERRG